MSFENFKKDIAEFDNAVKAMSEKQPAEQKEFKEPPSGKYLVGVDKMEIAPSKKDGSPVLKIQWRIQEGDFNKSCLFTNKKLAGTRNDNAVTYFATVLLNKFAPSVPVKFNGDYDNLASQVFDLAQEIVGKVQCEVTYDKDNYGQIDILDCWEC